MNLQTPIQNLFMIGPVYAKRLQKLGIFTVSDLLYHFPRRYDDYSLISKISRVQPGEVVTIQGTVTQMKNEYTKRGKKIQKAVVSDETDSIEIVWFNQPFLIRAIRVGEKYNFSGKADWFGNKIVMVSPEYEKIDQVILVSEARPESRNDSNDGKVQPIHTGRFVPVYPETYGISSKWLRSRISPIIKQCSENLFEYLPYSIIKNNDLVSLKDSIEQIHFPKNKESAEEAKQRFSFEELFLIQLSSLKRRLEWNQEAVGHKLAVDDGEISKFVSSLPFVLTHAQNRVLKEILDDLSKDKPMNRLLEGDVGSGKTVIAAIAAYVTFLNGYKSIFMAPTEILAFQHFQTLKKLLEPFGVKLALITSSYRHSDKRSASRISPLIDSGVGLRPPQNDENTNQDILIGTQALLFREKKLFDNVSLVVIDEQHRFGVNQRTALREKAINPHILTMTATPIPRTAALTLYGELDLSILDEMPTGRTKIKTWVVPKEKRNGAYEWIRKQIKSLNCQAFIICPLIEESENLVWVKAVKKEFERLKKEIFPDLRLGLIHGKLKTKEKEDTVLKFRGGDLDILVATPVIEVGLDIPNATIMMIEGAERFGLAQLHQLRGRVGRSDLQSYCLLFSDSENLERLKVMEKIYIGSRLAEIDLETRGPGDIYGTRQHGIINLKIAKLSDFPLIKKTRKAAEETIGNLDEFPLLKEKLKEYKIETVSQD